MAQLDPLRDYTNHRRLQLSGDQPRVRGHTTRMPYSGDTGTLGSVIRAGYYYNVAHNDFITDSTPNSSFIHAAFNYSATSGGGRGIYMVTKFSAAGTAAGECIRARTQVSAALTGLGIHGIHAESRLLSGGSCSGMTAGIRATLAADSGCTLTTGTHHVLRLDSDLGVTSTAANASFIGLYDVQSNKIPFFLDLVGITDGAASAFYDGGTVSLFTAGGLKVKLPSGVTAWIPLGTTNA